MDAQVFVRPTVWRSWLGIALVGTLLALFVNVYLRENPWILLDWGQNYAGGLVRRGLLGEALLLLSEGTGLDTIHAIFGVAALAYGVFFFFVYRLLSNLESTGVVTLLLFSPFFSMQALNNLQVAGRKEVLLFAAFSGLCWWVSQEKAEPQRVRAIQVFLVLSTILVMTHEALAFFLGHALVLGVVCGVSRSGLRRVALSYAFPIAALALMLLFRGGEGASDPICARLTGVLGAPAAEAGCLTAGPAEWLDGGVAFSLTMMRYYAKELLESIGPAVILVGIAFVPIFRALRPSCESSVGVRGFHGIVAIAVLGSVPLFIIATDWGRWILINAVLLGCTSIVGLKMQPRSHEADDHQVGLPLLVIAVYAFGWGLRHGGILVGPHISTRILSKILLDVSL